MYQSIQREQIEELLNLPVDERRELLRPLQETLPSGGNAPNPQMEVTTQMSLTAD
jgi:hypothetical protein